MLPCLDAERMGALRPTARRIKCERNWVAWVGGSTDCRKEEPGDECRKPPGLERRVQRGSYSTLPWATRDRSPGTKATLTVRGPQQLQSPLREPVDCGRVTEPLTVHRRSYRHAGRALHARARACGVRRRKAHTASHRARRPRSSRHTYHHTRPGTAQAHAGARSLTLSGPLAPGGKGCSCGHGDVLAGSGNFSHWPERESGCAGCSSMQA
jgi:hypothetical protein